jgi:S-adenosylmethionine hydrolase
MDEFVGVCHGVIARIAPDAHVIDLSHAVPRQDVLRGAITLGRSVPYLPDDAVYLGVVDPGVGSERRAIVVRTVSGVDLVGPDNGLLSFAWDALGGVDAVVEVRSDAVVLAPVSRTFHGRDVFAPAAATCPRHASPISVGDDPERSGRSRFRVRWWSVRSAPASGVDGFGNSS